MARTTPRPSVAEASAAHTRQGKRRLMLGPDRTESPPPDNNDHVSAGAYSAVQAAQSPLEDDNWNNILKTEPLISAASNGAATPPLPYEAPPLPVAADAEFISPFAALEAEQPTSYECCGNCMGALPNVNRQYAASCALWFCICCHSALPASLFPSEQPGKERLLRRCTACIEAAPERGEDLRARLPLEIQRGVEVAQALAQVYREVHLVFKASVHLPPHIQPKMQKIELADQHWQRRREEFGLKLSRTVQQHGVATSESLFFEWVEVENERVLLEMQRAELWSEVVACENVSLSRTACDLMNAAGIVAHLPHRKKLKSDTTTSQTTCSHCDSTLTLPEPVDDSAFGLCDCCERCLPLAAMKQSPKLGRRQGLKLNLCLSCSLAPQKTRAERSISVRDGLGAKSYAMSRAVAAVIEELQAVKATSVFQDAHYQHIAECVGSAQAERRSIHARNVLVFATGWTPIDQSRKMYEEIVSLDENLGRALASQLRVLLEAAVACTRQIPREHLELAAGIYDEIELSKQLQSYLANRNSLPKPTKRHLRRSSSVSKQPAPPPLPPPPPKPPQTPIPMTVTRKEAAPKIISQSAIVGQAASCDRCNGTLSVIGASSSKVALCDCCKRALPELLLDPTPLRSGVIVCQNCSFQHFQRKTSTNNWPVRPSDAEIQKLFFDTKNLRAHLEQRLAMAGTTLDSGESQSMNHHVTTVEKARVHRRTVIEQQRQRMSSGRVTPKLSSSMYAEQVDADRAVEKALKGFWKMLKRVCTKRLISINTQPNTTIAWPAKTTTLAFPVKAQGINSSTIPQKSTAQVPSFRYLVTSVKSDAGYRGNATASASPFEDRFSESPPPPRHIVTRSMNAVKSHLLGTNAGAKPMHAVGYPHPTIERGKSVHREVQHASTRSASIHRSQDASRGRSKSQHRTNPSHSAGGHDHANASHAYLNRSRGSSKSVHREVERVKSRSSSKHISREASRGRSQSQHKYSRDRSPSRHRSRDASRGRSRSPHEHRDFQGSRSQSRLVSSQDSRPEEPDRRRAASKSVHRDDQYTGDRSRSRPSGGDESRGRSKSQHRSSQSDREASYRHETSRSVHRERESSRSPPRHTSRDKVRGRSKSAHRRSTPRGRSKSTHREAERTGYRSASRREDSRGRSTTRRERSPSRHQSHERRSRSRSPHHRRRDHGDSASRRKQSSRSRSRSPSRHRHHVQSQRPSILSRLDVERSHARPRSGDRPSKDGEKPRSKRAPSQPRARSRSPHHLKSYSTRRSRSRSRGHDSDTRRTDNRRSRSPRKRDVRHRERSRDRERSNALQGSLSARR